MNKNIQHRASVHVAFFSLLALLVLSGTDCPLEGFGLQPPLDPIISASIVSTPSDTKMNWTWAYQELNPGIRPASIAVTIFREGTNLMPNETPETIPSGTVTIHEFTVTQVSPGSHTIRFVCTYPPGTIPSTATYEHSDSW